MVLFLLLLLFHQIFVYTVIISIAEVTDVITKVVEVHFLISFIGFKEIMDIFFILVLFFQLEVVQYVLELFHRDFFLHPYLSYLIIYF
jgi:hypothetical protein